MSSQAYPEQTRRVARACQALGLTFADLDDGGGYLWAIGDGISDYVGGAGAICAYPLNGAAACQIARDKAHTAKALTRAGLPAIEGRLYFITEDRIALRGPGREIADAVAWLEARPGPVFCKPNTGSGGDFAEIVDGPAAFLDYAARAGRRHEAVLIQPVLSGEEYRVFCLDGEAVFFTAKSALTLHGDGARPLAALLAAEDAKLAGLGVSPAPANLLVDQGFDPARVLAAGQSVSLAGRRNLAAGGEAMVSGSVPAPLAELAIRASAAVGLRVCGVDIFDLSADASLSDLTVIELNGNPAMTSLAEAGREDLADDIWRRILGAYFTERKALRR